MNKYWLIFFLLYLGTPISSFSVEPDEILADATLENRARVISKDLRCLVCQNENIDSSSADLARDLRLLVRERLVAGDSNEEVISYVVQRYGDFALLKPRFSGNSVILWSIGPLVLICSILFLIKANVGKKMTRKNEDLQLTKTEEEEIEKYLSKNR